MCQYPWPPFAQLLSASYADRGATIRGRRHGTVVYPPVHLDRLLLSVATPGIQPSHREAGLVRGWALHGISPCPLHDALHSG